MDKTIKIALQPGRCDLVIETMGHNLGRIISRERPFRNTGTPGLIGGAGKERVTHSPAILGKSEDRRPVERDSPSRSLLRAGVVVAYIYLVWLIRDGYP